MTEQNHNTEENIGTEILELVAKVWKNRTTIYKWCGVGILLALVVGFSLPKYYKSGVVLAPETQTKTNSSISSIASMMGVNLNNNVDAISQDMYPDVIHSTPFVFDLLYLPVTFERRDSVITTTLFEYMDEYQKRPWWGHIMAAPFKALGWGIKLIIGEKEKEENPVLDPTNLPKDERDVVKDLAEMIQIMIDKKSGKITISMSMQDPKVVATVMNAVTENLKTYMTAYRTSKLDQDIQTLEVICSQRRDEYYKALKDYTEFCDANMKIVRLSADAEKLKYKQEVDLAYQIYSQVAIQLEGVRIQAEQAKPVYVIIEPVSTPIKKHAPSKAKLLVLYTFLAGCFSVIWILFGKDYWQKFKNIL